MKHLVFLSLCALLAGPVWADNSVQAQIKAECQRYSDAWNAGDLDTVKATHHPSYIYVSASGPADLQKRFAGLDQRFAGDDRGTLSFHDLTVRPMGPDYALAYGIARLVLKDGTQSETWFTGVYQKTDQGWLAIHDQG